MGIGQTIGYLKRVIPQYAARDSIILADQSRKCEKNRVNLHWYAMGCDTEKQNVGDYLSTVVVEQMKLRAGVDDGRYLPRTRHLYAIGSILQAGFQNATVWGSGFIADPTGSRLGEVLHSSRLRTLDVRAVRGPLTRQALLKLGHECPAIYGDPAILMPLFYTPAEQEKRKYTFVGHYADKCSQEENGLRILTTDYRLF